MRYKIIEKHVIDTIDGIVVLAKGHIIYETVTIDDFCDSTIPCKITFEIEGTDWYDYYIYLVIPIDLSSIRKYMKLEKELVKQIRDFADVTEVDNNLLCYYFSRSKESYERIKERLLNEN